ncbi:MAG TPA: MgtC/SapB family protein [Candidatus Sulfotelmatobacter sp.]|nr:MgtC/SapB family protein [Candidatus Sulfotelmatobacter sp.]
MIKSGQQRRFRAHMQTMNWQHFLDLLQREMASGVVDSSVARLSLAAVLGGLIGLERELKHRPAGLRTNLFICFGAAMFTLLSQRLAGIPSDAARIAAQIIPGIGFIGAGTILHVRGLTTGLTSAATLFVVASVGMAAGGGLYLTASFATGLVLLSLFVLGHLEETFNLKVLMTSYEVTGPSVDEISCEVNRILESQHRLMQNVSTGATPQHVRLQFDVEGCHREQHLLLQQLRGSSVLMSSTCLGRVERE